MQCTTKCIIRNISYATTMVLNTDNAPNMKLTINSFPR